MENEEQSPIDESDESSSKSLVLIIAAIWIGVALVAGAVFFLGNENTTETDATSFTQIDDQLKNIQDQLKSDPNNLDLLMGLGHLYLDTDRASEAIPVFEKVLSFDPNNLDAKVDIVVANMKLGQTNGQLKKLDDILKIEPTYDYALYVKANFLSSVSNDYQGALAILKDLEKIITDQDKLKTVKDSISNAQQELDSQQGTSKSSSQ